MRASTEDLVRNLLLTRTSYLRTLLDPRRDIAAECGHPETLSIEDYNYLWERGDVARRIVTLFPEESWSQSPQVIENEDDQETEFERLWKDLEDSLKIWSVLQRADILSGIGCYGVLLFGFDDGEDLSVPLEPNAKRKLLYLRPFEETVLTISKLETDAQNPRFGLPSLYTIQFSDTGSQSNQTRFSKTLSVHHSRILHICDNRQNSDVYGMPRMKPVYNRLLDLRKIAGGSGEMFWKGGFPGLSLEAANPEDDVTIDTDATKEMVDQYMNGLQRYIALTGMSAKSLAPQVADPKSHAELQLKLIAATLGCPWRVFIGSEASQLASSQDTRAWNTRINRRRNEYLTPFVIRPFIDKLIENGILPDVPEYDVQWPDLNSPSDEEKASVAEKRTNSISKYVQSSGDMIMPPFHFLTLILGLTDEQARAVIEELGDRIDDLNPDDDLNQDDDSMMDDSVNDPNNPSDDNSNDGQQNQR